MDTDIYFREVPLLPTQWVLDVFVGMDEGKKQSLYNERYGDYDNDVSCNEVTVIHSDEDSPLKGEIRIVMSLEAFDPAILSHELIHVLWRLSRHCQTEMNFNSQEWQACMFEYLMNECLNKTKYQQMKLISTF